MVVFWSSALVSSKTEELSRFVIDLQENKTSLKWMRSWKTITKGGMGVKMKLWGGGGGGGVYKKIVFGGWLGIYVSGLRDFFKCNRKHFQWISLEEEVVGTVTIWIPNTWNLNLRLFCHFFAQFSNALITWNGGPFENQKFYTVKQTFWSSIQTTIQNPDYLSGIQMVIVNPSLLSLYRLVSTLWIPDRSIIKIPPVFLTLMKKAERRLHSVLDHGLTFRRR